MKDTLAALLAFLFAEDHKAHPMPPHKASSMLQKIKNICTGNTFANKQGEKNHG